MEGTIATETINITIVVANATTSFVAVAESTTDVVVVVATEESS